MMKSEQFQKATQRMSRAAQTRYSEQDADKDQLEESKERVSERSSTIRNRREMMSTRAAARSESEAKRQAEIQKEL